MSPFTCVNEVCPSRVYKNIGKPLYFPTSSALLDAVLLLAIGRMARFFAIFFLGVASGSASEIDSATQSNTFSNIALAEMRRAQAKPVSNSSSFQGNVRKLKHRTASASAQDAKGALHTVRLPAAACQER